MSTKDHVVTNLMIVYLAVTNSTYAQELRNTSKNYWPGNDLPFPVVYGRDFDAQIDLEKSMKAYPRNSKRECFYHTREIEVLSNCTSNRYKEICQ